LEKGVSKFSMKADEQELCLLGSSDNIVQGLSNNDIGESEEDMISDEVQGSQSEAKQQLGMVRCSQPALSKLAMESHMDINMLDVLVKGSGIDLVKRVIPSEHINATSE
jgi:hypothetical protein